MEQTEKIEEEDPFTIELKPKISVSDAYQIIERQLREHTKHEHILLSKKAKKGKLPPKGLPKEFAGSVFWKDPRRLRTDHWMEFLIFGKPLAHKVIARASNWEYELKHEKLVLEKIWEAIKVAFGKPRVTVETFEKT